MISVFFFFSIDDLLRDTDSELDDDDDEAANRSKAKKAAKRKDKQAYLMETGEDEIVDFMDPAASKQVLGKFCCFQIKVEEYKQTWV